MSLDFRDEVDELCAFLEVLKPEDWNRETGFMQWTPWDVIGHLHYFDLVSLVALEGEEVFQQERRALFSAIGAGRTNRELARERFGDLDAMGLREKWRDTAHSLAEALGQSDPKRRLPWFGPDMGVQMFTTARYMETWAHGQEIYDLAGAKRNDTDRIENIATIGMKTFGWTFVNRKLEIPGPPPYVRLVAPSGAIWEWNDPSETECVRGDAVDFCHVVTQGRNIADTGLEVAGPVATQWMAIAQCFAGGPVDPPKPGTRG
ncbi:MAG: TIGR03084 family metal-binding protein [Myxococcota bacterium]|nr:TIGR03084 family metal-binding protein [Myxococcota bacterium]MDP6241821.1 TIGR03084 family metal-binding protein [Myxococcota bacterium]MDP7074534.1 TIGR03084 family metal-binding protein [Myxococcota bacterium]MDP7298382.1 TIGR03084 family metal-binding protein [Myxococcota bacterium]MDP7431089.1 TIGR03084 family metal-binding protein [Myxococcota bacterium]